MNSIGRTVFLLSFSAIVSVSLFATGMHAAVIVDDSFTDVDRTNTGPLQADWWSSNSTSGNSIEIDADGLGLVTGTSGRGIHGTFAPQTLAIGESITATYTFTTPASVGTDESGSFKVALMDFNNAGLAADLSSSSSSSNPLYVGQPGYYTDFDINRTGGNLDNHDVSIRKHDTSSSTGRFLGTSGEWDSLGTSSDGTYAILPSTAYVGVFSVTRTGADSADIFSSLSQGATLLDSHMESDASDIANNFGMIGFWANSDAFGSTNSSDPDNGITFTNIRIEVIPEPSSVALLVAALIALRGFGRRASF